MFTIYMKQLSFKCVCSAVTICLQSTCVKCVLYSSICLQSTRNSWALHVYVLQYYLLTIYTQQLSFKFACSTVLFVYNLHETAQIKTCVFYSTICLQSTQNSWASNVCVLQYYLLTIYTKQLIFKCVSSTVTICLQSTRNSSD